MSKSNIYLVFITIIVFFTLVYAFMNGGSPKSVQNKRFDNTRIQDIQTIKNWVNTSFQSNSILPKTIQAANKGYNANSNIEIPKDPESKEDYEYVVSSASEFKLCATFKEATSNNSYSSQNMSHPSGRHCFTFTAGKY